MAIIQHPLYQGITVDTSTATQSDLDVPIWDYTAIIDGRQVDLPGINVSPEDMANNLKDDNSNAYVSLAAALKGLRQPQVSTGGIFSETVVPALTRTPANILGAPADLANAILGGADLGINVARWAAGGFDEFPDDRILSSDPKKVYGGSEQIARGMEYIGDLARKADIYSDREMGTYGSVPVIGEVPYDLGISDLALAAFKFNTTPNEGTKARKYVSIISQVIGAAPVEGALIAKLAIQLAKTTTNPTAEHVYDALSEMQRNNPIKAAAVETAMGTAAGGGMVGSLEGLESVYPDAPQWMKNTIMAGGAIALPLGAMTAGSVAYSVAREVPIVSWPLRILAGAMESLTISGAEKAAARTLQRMGGDWKNRDEILGVTGQFKLALKEGRTMDEATRIAYTTPQLARNEAAVLEAQLNAAAGTMSAADVAVQRNLIEEMRRYANFQEGHLKTLSSSGNVGAQAYSKYSERVMDRRDSIFAALNEAFLKLDLGGKESFETDPSVIRVDYERGLPTGNFEFNVNRLRAFQEGRIGSLSEDQIKAVSQAYEVTLAKMSEGAQAAIKDAEERITALRESQPKDMSDQERTDFNMWIRDEMDTAYKEIDNLEDVLWNSIRGMNLPKTDSYITPSGTDLGPQILIDGVPIGEHFAAKAAALKAGEHENQSKWLWKLSGRDALVKQAGKGGGADAERVAKQNIIVDQNEANVARLQNLLDAASGRLRGLEETPSVNPELRKARLEEQRLEDELRAILAEPDSSVDLSAIRRTHSVNQKLAGLRGTVKRLEAEPYTDAALTKANEAFLKAQDNLEKATIALDTSKGNLEISWGKGVDHEGNPVNLADEVADSSILGVKRVDDVPIGREAQEVQNVISSLKREMSFEQGRPVLNPSKIKAIGGLIDDLQSAIANPENFSVDTVTLGAARQMSALKNKLFRTGVVGRLRGFTTKGEPRVEPEKTIETIAPAAGQETNLRQIEAALTPVLTGEGTPFRTVTWGDGTTGPELDPNFNLQRYAEGPPPPFEQIQVGRGRPLGLQVAEGTQPTTANIEMVRNTLWDRFRVYDAGDTFNTKAAQRWIDENNPAIRWLAKATGKDTGFENIVNAERVIKTIKSANSNKLNRDIDELRERGAFNEYFTEEGLRLLVKEAAKRESDLASAALFLGEPNSLTMGSKFIESFLKDPNILNETIKILDNGALEGGSNPALQGFKQAVAEALINKALTEPGSGTGTGAAREADILSGSLGRTVRLWDPQALIGLAQDPKIGRLLGELYGEAAPEMFRRIAEGARLQSAISEAAARGIRIKDVVSDEWAGNIGRVLGGLAAKYVLPVSALVLTGAFRRYSMNAIANVRGSAIDRLIVDFLMDPELAVAAIKKYPVVSEIAGEKFWKRARLWGHQKFIGNNARRIERLGKTPGTLYEIGEPTKYMDLEEVEPTDDRSSLEPVRPPPRRAATEGRRPPVSASILSQPSVSPVGQRPTGQASQQTLTDLSRLGIPLFSGPIAAKHGGLITGGAGSGMGRKEQSEGIMSIRCKPRQLVG